MQGQEDRKPLVTHTDGDTEQETVMRELVYRLGESFGEMRRRLMQTRSLLAAGRKDPRDDAGMIDQILSETDAAYAIMVKLRWALLRRTDPKAIPQRERDEMNASKPVVIVDDDSPSVRRALSRLLQSVGLQVEVCNSALQFLELDLPDAPCCVVLDVRMPRMSGLDLQREMANRGIDIPIVFITGHGDIDMAVQAMKDGAVDFLPKPFNDQDLIDAINRAVARHQALRHEQADIAEVQERIDRLTPREEQVMELVITGMLNKQIAYDLGAGEKTIKVHRARVMEKMEAESVAELVKLAARVGIDGPKE